MCSPMYWDLLGDWSLSSDVALPAFVRASQGVRTHVLHQPTSSSNLPVTMQATT